jgi:nucleoside-diphosphate-sugar epimerase
VVRSTGSELKALRFLMRLRARARSSARTLSRALAMDDKRLARLLFGLEENKHFFRFRGPDHATERWQRQVGPLAAEARERLDGARAVAGDEPHLVLLLTGGTGFIGKEILWQAAANPSVAAVHAIIRPRTQKDRKTGEVRVVATSEQRGALLLDELGITDPEARSRFHFLTGDVEQSYFGLDPEELDRLARRVTHLVHCAASVSFDAPYEESYRANVVGTLRALELSRLLHRASGSPFVAHIGVETSYIHGRRLLAPAQEDTLGFPRNHYNNYYELTKAMASIETERFMVEEALPVIQLCPSIVIGEATTGNNRGDTKVVNAPVNLFGRMGEVLGKPKRGWQERSKVAVLARLSAIFPSDPSAQINLIPVDRVAAGVLASLSHPEAVGHRVHLANDRRITVREIVDIVDQELGVKVRLVEPNLHRNVGLPIVGRLLESLGGKAIVRSIGKMTDIFGGYAEWGQPVHQVGNDVRLLGLDPERPDPRQSFRMLCRHNRWVQRFGRIKSSEKLAERERSWSRFLGELELTQGASAADLSPGDFSRAAVEAGF